MINLSKVVLLITIMLFGTPTKVSLDDIYEVVKHVESNNNPKAVGDNGRAFGIVQIHKICVDDVNRVYKTTYTHNDAFNEVCAKEIFVLYLQMGVDRYVKKYKTLPNEKRIVQMWNFGVYRTPHSNGYWNKYLKYKNKQQ